jgi:hypothetical protein
LEISETRAEVAELRGELKVVADNVKILLEKGIEKAPQEDDESTAKTAIKKLGKKEIRIIVVVACIVIIGLSSFVVYKVNKVVSDINDAKVLIESVKGE